MTRLSGRHGHMTTGARLGALAMPFSRGILLRRQKDASCHVGGRRRARRSSEPACAAAWHARVPRRLGHPGSTWRPRSRAGEHGIARRLAAKELSHLAATAAVPQLLVAAAPRLWRSRSSADRGGVHHDAAAPAPVRERPEVPSRRLTAWRHAAHAHKQQVNAGGPVGRAGKQAISSCGVLTLGTMSVSEEQCSGRSCY